MLTANCQCRLGALILFSLPAHAEEFDDIVVTAQRRVESVQSVPRSVSVFNVDELIKLGWDRSHEIAAQVPNMQVSAPFGDVQPLFAIRGISMVDYAPSQSSPIGLYVDEGYLAPTYTHGMSMFDLERIEVLRGPQGTLYGKNTTGGAINLITASPEIGAPSSGNLTIGAGNFDMTSLDAALESTLIDDRLAGRIAINYKRDDGFWQNSNGPDMGQRKKKKCLTLLQFQTLLQRL